MFKLYVFFCNLFLILLLRRIAKRINALID